jgi:serine protease Do
MRALLALLLLASVPVVDRTVAAAHMHAAHPSLAPRVPRMTAPVVNVQATRGLVASSMPFVGSLVHRRPIHSVGSGVLIASDGLILTNEHIVHGASSVVVELADHRELKAFVVAADGELDLALLRVDAHHPLPTVRLGDSSKLRVGDYVVAVGSPYGLERSVTQGIVSAHRRILDAGPSVPLIQTDASINPGNSGGPLYDLDGRLVGLNTAIVAGSHGIGFAVPVNVLRRALPQLERDGRIQRGAIGVRVGNVPPEIARALALHHPTGALVESVEAGGPGAKAGLLPGDVIVRWDGEAVDDPENLPWMVELTAPGSRVQVTLLREGDSIAREILVRARGDHHQGL